jgi:hypothetical protein
MAAAACAMVCALRKISQGVRAPVSQACIPSQMQADAEGTNGWHAGEHSIFCLPPVASEDTIRPTWQVCRNRSEESKENAAGTVF